MQRFSQKPKTSWEAESQWYGDLTGGAGHYYHEHVVIPGVIRLLNLTAGAKILDLGCGTGVLARSLKEGREYTGVDISSSLITEAKKTDHNPKHNYLVDDITKPLYLGSSFTHATLILSLQNVKDPIGAINNAAKNLGMGGVLIIVLNHPCFRIPRQSSWGIDEASKLQYRRINRYSTPLEIPITMHPGKHNSPLTWSYHQPLSAYTKMLKDSGFLIDTVEEWSSDKTSVGKAAKMENLARSEFPLFLTLKAIKK